jgi:hypothetical protein
VNWLRLNRRGFLGAFAGTAAVAALGTPVVSIAAELTRGFEKVAPAYASGEEINRQKNIWVMEVEFKSMRMIFLESKDPKTGEPRKDHVIYLAYRAINRPLAGRKPDNDLDPKNEEEPKPGPEQFLPAFTLVTYDNPATEIPSKVYEDEVIPAADRRINQIETRRSSGPKFLDSVHVVQDLPAPVDAKEEQQPYIYGVATFRNVDPDADFFKVIMQGFSNGYQLVKGPDGQPLTMRKVIVQRVIRRGDRYDPNQAEFLFDGNPKWEYQPESNLATPPVKGGPAVEAAPAVEEAAPAEEAPAQ